MTMGREGRRIRRRGAVREAAALAALVAAGCMPATQPPATDAALGRVAAAVHRDIYDRPVALAPVLAGRAVLYFFRTDCGHCRASLAAVGRLPGGPDAPALILISREDAPRLRAALGPAPRPGLIVVSDRDGALMGSALPTRYVPRVIAVERFRVRLDATGAAAPGLPEAVAALARRRSRGAE